MTKTAKFEPYEGWEEDVRQLAGFHLAYARQAPGIIPPGGASTNAARHLLAAFPPPECGKVLRHGNGISMRRYADGAPRPITCTLPKDHDGPHADETLQGEWR